MNIEQYTIIKTNKQTKVKTEEQYNINEEIILNEDFNYYLKLETIKNYYILYNDDIFSNCLSIFKRIKTQNELQDVKNYSLRLISEVDEEIRLYEEEQERLRLEEKQNEEQTQEAE